MSLSHEDLHGALNLRRAGVPVSAIAAALRMSRRYLALELDRFEATLPAKERRSVVELEKGKSQRRKCAGWVFDLWELLHLVRAQGRPPTLGEYGVIKGTETKNASLQAFYRMRSWLKRHGVRIERRTRSHAVRGLAAPVDVTGIEGLIEIVFNDDEVWTFLCREIAAAGRVIEEHEA